MSICTHDAYGYIIHPSSCCLASSCWKIKCHQTEQLKNKHPFVLLCWVWIELTGVCQSLDEYIALSYGGKRGLALPWMSVSTGVVLLNILVLGSSNVFSCVDRRSVQAAMWCIFQAPDYIGPTNILLWKLDQRLGFKIRDEGNTLRLFMGGPTESDRKRNRAPALNKSLTPKPCPLSLNSGVREMIVSILHIYTNQPTSFSLPASWTLLILEVSFPLLTTFTFLSVIFDS
jgi:hypothetical protein